MLATTLITFLLVLFGAAPDASDPWTKEQLIEPAALVKQLSAKPAVLYVGPKLLYKSHIPGAVLAGPTGKPDGMDLFKQALGKLPRDREVIVYCGCCPWNMCPNIRPAFKVLQEMGFKKAKILTLPTSFLKDWIEKDYPVEKDQ